LIELVEIGLIDFSSRHDISLSPSVPLELVDLGIALPWQQGLK
jgi:hypothetical protein